MSASLDNPKADFFLDGQNLFHSAKQLWGYQHPNFDVMGLCRGIAKQQGLAVGRVFFYTGMPGQVESPTWHEYWVRRLAYLGKLGVTVFNPPLRYIRARDADGRPLPPRPSEKGVDVRIALDMVRSAADGAPALVLLSRDQDLAIAAQEARDIATRLGNRIQVFSAYPVAAEWSWRGVDGTTWIPMSREFYDQHLDPRDYRGPAMRAFQEARARRADVNGNGQISPADGRGGMAYPRPQFDSAQHGCRAMRIPQNEDVRAAPGDVGVDGPDAFTRPHPRKPLIRP